jgi:MFS family permease
MDAAPDDRPSRHDAPPARAQAWALHTITCVNSLGTGVLWNGLSFLVERDYAYTQQETLALYVGAALAYALAAWWTGSLLRRLGNRVSPRAFLGWIFVAQGLTAPLVLIPGSSIGLVVAATVLSVAGALMWPVVEAYVSSGKDGHAMRRSIGLWSINWMVSVGACLLLMAPLYATGHTRWAMVAVLPISVLSIVCLRFLPRAPAPHGDQHHDAPESYRPMLASARVLLPTAYIVVGAISPILPYAIDALAIDPAWRTPLGSLWLFARAAAVSVLALTHFWHGRWQGLAIAALALAGGFTMAAFAPNTITLVIGLVSIGLGHGLLYYSALYYAMRLERADVDAGGVHEALIGVGYVIGPGAALAGGMWDGARGIVIVELIVLAMAMLLALRAWRRAARPATP